MVALVDQLAGFLTHIGVGCDRRPIHDDTVLPGLLIDQGILVIDLARLTWPGDILHEAGHIAVTSPELRHSLTARLPATPADEMAAMAWSYAAALAADVDPALVFHQGGYPMGATALLAAFESADGVDPPGVPMLRWYGMTDAYPTMTRWLRPGG